MAKNLDDFDKIIVLDLVKRVPESDESTENGPRKQVLNGLEESTITIILNQAHRSTRL